MLSMKKSMLFVALILCVLVSLLLFGCNKDAGSVYTYISGDVEYRLTLYEKESAFLLEEGEKQYEGKFTYVDGSVVLENEEFGYKTVKLLGDTFEFIANPTGKEEVHEPCEHVWDDGTYTAGNCKTYGNTLYTCTKCGETKAVPDVVYGSHSLDEGRHVSGQTCSDRGYTLYTCIICREYTEKEDDPENSDNHVYVATETIRDDGCDKVLKRLYRCSRCGVEKYLGEDSRAIGAHDYDEETGICNVCHRLKNGLSTVHEYKEGDDCCFYCGEQKSVLEGAAANPCGYTEKGKVYIGVYPQILAAQSAKEIRANGLYDAALDCWYYDNEAYVIRKAETRSDLNSTFSDGTTKIQVGDSYAFLLLPLAFIETENGYVCDKIVDSESFLKEYAVINGGITNEWEDSTLRTFLTEKVKVRIGVEEVEEVDLLTEDDLPSVSKKTVTDYALAGGMSFWNEEGTRWGKWYTKTPSEDSSENVRCVGYEGQTEDARVTAVRGVVPVVRLRQGE